MSHKIPRFRGVYFGFGGGGGKCPILFLLARGFFLKIGNEILQTEVFLWTSARHVRAKMLVSQDLELLTEVLAGCPQGRPASRKLPLWADFSFLMTSWAWLPKVLQNLWGCM